MSTEIIDFKTPSKLLVEVFFSFEFDLHGIYSGGFIRSRSGAQRHRNWYLHKIVSLESHYLPSICLESNLCVEFQDNYPSFCGEFQDNYRQI